MKNMVWRISLFALVAGAVAHVPALAGSAVIGSVAGSMNASVGSQALLPNTTIFSGDSLQVRDGVAVIAVGNTNRVVFGRDTVASFLKGSNDVTVLLTKGNVSMLHPDGGSAVRVKAGPISITPTAGFKTLGEVAMLNGSLVITAKEGALQVDGQGTSRNVTKGQTIVISPKNADKKGGGAGWGGGSNTLEVVTLGVAGAGAVLAGVAMSRAGSAKDNAAAATAAGQSATSAANAATSAANAATSAANAATSAANAATSAANAANSSAIYAGFLAACADDFARQGNTASASQLFGGSQCPTYVPTGPGTTPP